MFRISRDSIMSRFRSRSRSASARAEQRSASSAPKVPDTVPEVPLFREGPILQTSSSAIFISKMNTELLLSQFKRAQEAYFSGNIALCEHRCTELLATPALHLDTRIETLQLLATIVSLPVAQGHLRDALCLLDLAVERGGISPTQMQALLGLKITTLDILARVEKEMTPVTEEEGGEQLKRKGSLKDRTGRRLSKLVEKKKTLYRPLAVQDESMPLRQS